MLISILGVDWNIYRTTGSSCSRYQISTLNDIIILESAVEYCNTVNLRL